MKNKQINIRVTEKQKSQINHFKDINGYDNISDYIIDLALDKISLLEDNRGNIVTVSLSPAIDYVIQLDDQLSADTPVKFLSDNRLIYSAGKAIHESMIIDEFGVPTIALHYSGGFTGDLLEADIKKLGFKQIRFRSKIETRINLKLNINEDTYEVSELPPKVDEKNQERILKSINNLNHKDILSIAGSYNPKDFELIEGMCKIANKKDVEIALDLSSKDLLKLLQYNPYLVKPNKFELENILNKKFGNENDIIKGMNQMQALGAKNIAVSMGSEGSILLTEDGRIFRATVIEKIKPISAQGAGDSFVGAFLAKKGTVDVKEQFRWANAAGAATVECMKIATFSNIKKMFDNIKITEIKNK